MRILHMEQGLYVLLLEQSEDNYLGAYSLEDSCAQKVMELYEAPLQ